MYCKPRNEGLASTSRAVARKLGEMFDAMDVIGSVIVEGNILADIRNFRQATMDALEADGWVVGHQNGQLVPTNRCHIYPPRSAAGERIRKDRKAITR